MDNEDDMKDLAENVIKLLEITNNALLEAMTGRTRVATDAYAKSVRLFEPENLSISS